MRNIVVFPHVLIAGCLTLIWLHVYVEITENDVASFHWQIYILFTNRSYSFDTRKYFVNV